MKRLSPGDPLTELITGILGAGGCKAYLVGSFYVRHDRILAKFVKEVRSLGGRILDVDEVSRAVRARIPLSRFERLYEIASNYIQGSGVEIKISCSAERSTLERLARSLRGAGFKFERPSRGLVGYGVVQGLLIEVEAAEARLHVKIGRTTAAARISSKPPPGMFLYNIYEAREVVRLVRGLLDVAGRG